MRQRILFKIGLIGILALSIEVSCAQTSSMIVFGNIGYATFSGGDAKSFNTEFQESLQPLPAKIVSNYPGYLMFSGKVSMIAGYHLNMVSLYAEHTSTGSRVSYVDYSGGMYLDQRVVTTSLGAEMATPIFRKNTLALYGGMRYVANFNRLEMDSKVQTPSNYDHLNLNFRNLTHGFQPTLYLMKSIKFLVANLEVGYQFQIPQKLFLEEDGKTYLVDKNNDAVMYSGAGFRFQIGLGYRFANSEDE